MNWYKKAEKVLSGRGRGRGRGSGIVGNPTSLKMPRDPGASRVGDLQLKIFDILNKENTNQEDKDFVLGVYLGFSERGKVSPKQAIFVRKIWDKYFKSDEVDHKEEPLAEGVITASQKNKKPYKIFLRTPGGKLREIGSIDGDTSDQAKKLFLDANPRYKDYLVPGMGSFINSVFDKEEFERRQRIKEYEKKRQEDKIDDAWWNK